MVMRHRERGFALIVAIAAIAILAAAVLMVGRQLQLELVDHQMVARDLHLAGLADAAVATSLAELDRDGGFRGLAGTPVGDGMISSDIMPTDAGSLLLRARGQRHGWRRVITAEILLTPDGPRVTSWTQRTVFIGH